MVDGDKVINVLATALDDMYGRSESAPHRSRNEAQFIVQELKRAGLKIVNVST